MRRTYAAGLAAIGTGVAVCFLIARPRYLRWGATHAEAQEPLPGDDLIVKPNLSATRAITVRAAVEQVWPWIAQMGPGRAGLYSHDWLENLVSCDIHSADCILREWRDVEVGDEFRLHLEVPLQVAAVEPGRSLVVRGGVPMGNTLPPYDFTWAFTLRDGPDWTTRLLVRERYGYTRWWAPLLVEPVEAVSFVMSQKRSGGFETGPNGPAVPVPSDKPSGGEDI